MSLQLCVFAISIWPLTATRADVLDVMSSFHEEFGRLNELFARIEDDPDFPLPLAVENAVVTMVDRAGITSATMGTLQTTLSGHLASDHRRMELRFSAIIASRSLSALSQVKDQAVINLGGLLMSRFSRLADLRDEFKREHKIPDNFYFHLREDDLLLAAVLRTVRSNRWSTADVRDLLKRSNCDVRRKLEIIRFCYRKSVNEVAELRELLDVVIPRAGASIRKRLTEVIEQTDLLTRSGVKS